jgi:TetR/AcrR family transcriptional repressor of nem operon
LPRTTRQSPNPPGPLTANQQRRRARILDATRDLVTRHGYDGMIMRDVAALAEVSATTLYNLYNTKDELLLEALRERVTDSTARAARQTDGPGCAYLLAHINNVCEETRQTPAYVAAIAQALFRASPGDPLAKVLLNDLRGDVMRSLGAMKDARELKPDTDLEELATALAGSFWSVFLLWDKGLLKLADLGRAQRSGYLSALIPAARGQTRLALERNYDEINVSSRAH